MKLRELTNEQLVDLFTDLALQQDKAMLFDENRKFTRLYWKMQSIEDELKARNSDSRHLLSVLFRHPNAQVRLKAAEATLAVEPIKARAVLRTIKAHKEFPQALDAGMMLGALEDGSYQPT